MEQRPTNLLQSRTSGSTPFALDLRVLSVGAVDHVLSEIRWCTLQEDYIFLAEGLPQTLCEATPNLTKDENCNAVMERNLFDAAGDLNRTRRIAIDDCAMRWAVL